MRALRDRRVLIAVGMLVILVFVFQRQLGNFLSGPTPTFPTSAETSCGEEIEWRGGPPNVAARQCFWAAYEQRRPAEFRTTRSTIEGDPVNWTYRTRSDGSVEVIVDSREDRYSNGGISILDCRALVRRDDPALPDLIDFEVDGCVERDG